jgi:phosphomethylpyrimidine synthase
MAQLELTRKGIISEGMKSVAEKGGIDADLVRQGIAKGEIVIPSNPRHKKLDPCGIGKGLRTKINVNIGTSQSFRDVNTELDKLAIALEYKADTVMDLSTGGDTPSILRAIVSSSSLPVGTVPIY